MIPYFRKKIRNLTANLNDLTNKNKFDTIDNQKFLKIILNLIFDVTIISTACGKQSIRKTVMQPQIVRHSQIKNAQIDYSSHQ